MQTIADIIATFTAVFSHPELVARVAALFDITSMLLGFVASAFVRTTAPERTFALPLIVFAPRQLGFEAGNVVLPVEFMAVACGLTALTVFTRLERMSWEGGILAFLVGLFAPTFFVHIVNLLIHNINALLSARETGFFEVLPARLMYQMSYVVMLIGAVYMENAFGALYALLAQTIGGGIATVALFLLKLAFTMVGTGMGIAVVLWTVHAVASGLQPKVSSELLTLLVILLLISPVTEFAEGMVADSYVYATATLWHYTESAVLRGMIESFSENVLRYLAVIRGEEKANEARALIVAQPQDACSQSCESLLERQIYSLLSAAVPAVVMVVLLIRWSIKVLF